MRFLAIIGAFAILAAVAGAIYLLGGYYNVAVTEPNLGIADWALARIRTVSIERHAAETPPLSLDDPAVVQAGAQHSANSDA